jgi:hypothetical protein
MVTVAPKFFVNPVYYISDQYDKNSKDSEQQYCWNKVVIAISSTNPKEREKFVKCAKKVLDTKPNDTVYKVTTSQGVATKQELDNLELSIMGKTCTQGSVLKRKRFWRFVLFIKEGIEPQHLTTRM